MNKFVTFIKSMFFPDLYDEEIKMKNKVGLNHSHRIEKVGGGTYNIPEEKQRMVTLAIERAGLNKPDAEGNAVGFGVNITKLSDVDKKFIKNFEKALTESNTQEEFDELFVRMARIVKSDGYVASDLEEGEDPREILLQKLRERNQESSEGDFSDSLSEEGNPEAISEEKRIIFRDNFIDTTLDFFDESPFLRETTDKVEAPFRDLTYLPDAMQIESGRETIIINTLLAEYIKSGDILNCSKAVFDLGLNYAETHFGGMMIGYLHALSFNIHIPDELPNPKLNEFFGRNGLRKLKRLGIAFGLKAHLPSFDRKEFEIEMSNLLDIAV